jgi:predicted tellurium resistance membrane protein TerC
MTDLSFLTQPDAWISLATLTALEIVLGIDNIVFLSILVAKLPQAQQALARRLGLGLALGMRIGLLLAISWVMSLTKPLIATFGHEFSGRDLILLLGGLFLVAKATYEIHDKLEVSGHAALSGVSQAAFASVILQIGLLDMVFSIDSVITAVGMAKHIPVMIAAMVIAVVVMLVFARAIGEFVDRHPSMKILALSFLLLIGVMLVADGFGQHVNKGYIYFALAFSLAVEIVNIRVRKAASKPVQLHTAYEEAEKPS